MFARSLEEVLAGRLAELEELGLRRDGRAVRHEAGALLRVDQRTLVDFCSNDYLGLATDPRLARAAADALACHGTGAAAARLISGTHPLHERLEAKLASLWQSPAALLFGSGYAANTGAIAALAGPGDIIYSDALNHASIIDGCRLSRAETRVFPHADVGALRRLLEADRGRGGARWIVVEGVFSMDGDVFPLDRLVELAGEFGAWSYVDEAHAVGVLGPAGQGAAAHLGVHDRVDVIMGTLGKALGAAGAFVLGSPALREWLLNRSRTFVFSTAPPPALAAAALAALDIVATEPARRARLLSNARRLRDGLQLLGLAAPASSPGHIQPIPIGRPVETVHASRRLEQLGFAVGCIRPPSVPRGGSRLRISLSADHSAEQIDDLLDALGRLLPPRVGEAAPLRASP